MRGNVKSFSAGIFFHKSKMATRGGERMRGDVSIFPSAFFISGKSNMAVTVANAKYILEGEGLQGCGLGMRMDVRVEIMGLSRIGLRRVSGIRVKDRTQG